MQEYEKLTPNFMDARLSELSKLLFGIDRESRAILGILAKNGPATETKIARLGRRRSNLTRDTVRRRFLVTDLVNGFVTAKRGKKIRNLNKYERIYHLKFKGFLASLYETPIQENFWITEYISKIEQVADKTTADAFLNHIYYSVLAFMVSHSNRKNILSIYESPEINFYENYGFMSGTFWQILAGSKIEGIPSTYSPLLITSVVQFFLSCYTIGILLKTTLSKDPEAVNNGFNDDRYDNVKSFLKHWMWTMFKNMNANPRSTFKYLDHKDDPVESFQIGTFSDKRYDIILMVADEIAKIKPELALSKDSVISADEMGHMPSLI